MNLVIFYVWCGYEKCTKTQDLLQQVNNVGCFESVRYELE
jgi:hypothetical protein